MRANEDLTPAELLLRALARCPDALLRRAIASSSRDANTLRRLALDRSSVVRRRVAENPAIPVDVRTDLMKDPDRVVRERAAENVEGRYTAWDEFFAGPAWKSAVDPFRGALNPGTPAEMVLTLAHDPDVRIRFAAACRVGLRLELLDEAMAKHPLVSILELLVYAAKSEATSSEVLDWLRERSHRYICLGVESKVGTWGELLAKDANRDIRLAVASNPRASGEALASLAKDTEPKVRAAVAARSDAPNEVLRRLSGRQHWMVRASLGTNQAVTEEVLERLGHDAHDRVRLAVAKNPSSPAVVLEHLANDTREPVRVAVAANPSSPAPVLEHLANDTREPVRVAVAANPSSPAPVLEHLANDVRQKIRAVVAENQSTPPETRTALTDDPAPIVRRAALSGGALDLGILKTRSARILADPLRYCEIQGGVESEAEAADFILAAAPALAAPLSVYLSDCEERWLRAVDAASSVDTVGDAVAFAVTQEEH